MGGRPSAGTSACTSLKATPVPQSAVAPEVSSGRCGSTTAIAGGSSAPGQVVVGDDDADARRRAPRATVSTAVMPQSQVMTSDAPAARAAARPGGAEVVAVAEPVRHERHHVGAGRAERAGEQRRGALAVHVVVAVHQDGAAGPHRRRR